MDTAKKIGERLRSARNQANLTQAEVAEALESHSVTISRWERGEWLPSGQYQEKLCQLYGKRHEELFPELDEEQGDEQPVQKERNEITVEIRIPANLREAQTITITVTPPAQQENHTPTYPAPYLTLMEKESKETGL